MAGKRLEYDIVTDPSKGIAGLKQFAAAAKKSMKTVDDSLDDTTTSAQKLAKVLAGMADDLEGELEQAARAAEALSAALGPELAGRANVGSLVSDLNRMGLTFDEITADADVLAASLKRMDDVQLSGVNRGLGDVETSMGRVRADADQTGSVMANMAGNAAQDMGELAGVTGTAGVAIGQLAEYATEGNISLSSLVKLAGPMLGLAAATEIVSTIVSGIKFSEEFKAENIEQYVTALEELKTVAQSVKEEVLATGTLEIDVAGSGFLGLGRHAKDILPDIESVFDVIGSGNDALNEFNELASDKDAIQALRDRAALLIVPGSSDEQRELAGSMLLVAEAAERQGEDAAAATKSIEDYNRLNKVTRREVADTAKAFERAQDPISQFPVEFQRMADAINRGALPATEDMEAVSEGLRIELGEVYKISSDLAVQQKTKAVAAMEATAEATLKAVDAYIEWGQASAEAKRVLARGPTIESAVAGADKLFDQLFGLARIASANEEAFDALGQAIAENGHVFDLNTEAGRANQRVLESLAESLVPQIAANYKNAAGNLTAFAQSMERLKMGVFQQFRDETDLTDRQIGDIINRLGIFDGSKYSAQFDLLGLEDAETKVGLLLPLLETLNVAPDIVKSIALEVEAGDYDGALAAIRTGISSATPPAVTVGVGTDTSGVTSDVVTARNDAQRAVKPIVIPVYAAPGARGVVLPYDAGGTTGPGAGLVAERRPEIVNSRYLVTEPTIVPAGTKVTSGTRTSRILRTRGTRGLRRYDSGGTVTGPRQVNINLNAAVIGNPFEVIRAVMRAEKQADRLLGTRR